MAANGDEGRAVSVAGLNALLGMVERPLVAIGGGRRILGANRAYEPAALAIVAFAVTWACMGIIQVISRNRTAAIK